ncbi:hypothetical protein HaLaN_08169 [Haematococcus lacustris]|uniref:Uncharacterized protein n=1 Tax=Haematococcus lacustris TaxID=44745 RepID=A0A699YSC6_HAELA|nr:hypothetical protein HaLaN_08169 [Haematococcus lacustris]
MQKLSLSKCLPLCRPVNAMVGKKRGVQAKCSDVQKAREVMARRRAAEAEAKAQALAAELRWECRVTFQAAIQALQCQCGSLQQ